MRAVIRQLFWEQSIAIDFGGRQSKRTIFAIDSFYLAIAKIFR
jgi:hypothetical protein